MTNKHGDNIGFLNRGLHHAIFFDGFTLSCLVYGPSGQSLRRPKTNKPTFSDVPCEKLGMYTKKTIDGSKMSQADGLPRTNYVDENGKFIANRPVNDLQHRDADIVLLCERLKAEKENWERSKTTFGRNKAADLRYELSKNNCHLILK